MNTVINNINRILNRLIREENLLYILDLYFEIQLVATVYIAGTRFLNAVDIRSANYVMTA